MGAPKSKLSAAEPVSLAMKAPPAEPVVSVTEPESMMKPYMVLAMKVCVRTPWSERRATCGFR